ncbi:MAG: cysteine desulfurase [Coriobacteriales bacterium]|jgi:cysteine desulfurase|nr:cysteine desulfurase [Coriobacteriales bacterium]
MERIYLDHAATTPLRAEVLAAMQPCLTTVYGNANALYREGKAARDALEAARTTIAAAIGASPLELAFTSGGTEANNALITGIARAVRRQRGETKANHLICSAFEHHAVLEPVNALRREGFEVTLLKPRRDGFIHVEDLIGALRPNTLLVSIMAAQNELGTVQPLAALAQATHEYGACFHTDAVQALGKLPFDVGALGVDAASFSAHKLGGPKGAGAFYLRRQTPFAAVQLGGGQESGRRSGTQNVAGAVGFAKAVELACEPRALAAETSRLIQLRDGLAAGLLRHDLRFSLTVPIAADDSRRHLPGLLPILVDGFEAETLILRLDDAGFAVSSGSACSTGSLEPSHVLSSLGIAKGKAYGALRVSMGRETTQEQLAAFAHALAAIVRSGG